MSATDEQIETILTSLKNAETETLHLVIAGGEAENYMAVSGAAGRCAAYKRAQEIIREVLA